MGLEENPSALAWTKPLRQISAAQRGRGLPDGYGGDRYLQLVGFVPVLSMAGRGSNLREMFLLPQPLLPRAELTLPPWGGTPEGGDILSSGPGP